MKVLYSWIYGTNIANLDEGLLEKFQLKIDPVDW